MAAVLFSVISWLKGPKQSKFRHAFDLPWPSVMHQTLQDDFVKSFKEVFVIGDIHGCYDELVELINKAEVTNNSSLKIFVGDLVNKGPKNIQVLQFVRHSKSMLAVRGNHDEIALKGYFEYQNNNFTSLKHGDDWVKDLSKEDVSYLTELPYTITIPSLSAVIVHAGLVPEVLLENNSPADMVTMRNLVTEDGGIQPTKSDKVGNAWAPLWPGPEHVYFGHDAKRMLQEEKFATGLDTGCLYGNFLTGIFISGPKTGALVQVKAKQTYRVPKQNAHLKNNTTST